jgi:hypothetical protein
MSSGWSASEPSAEATLLSVKAGSCPQPITSEHDAMLIIANNSNDGLRQKILDMKSSSNCVRRFLGLCLPQVIARGSSEEEYISLGVTKNIDKYQ